MTLRKIFVGSLPNGIEESTLRAEFEKYGPLESVYIKKDCEPGRQWAFITYLHADNAQRAKELCDRVLTFPGSEKPCDVMVAKNQGMGGERMPGASYGGAPAYHPAISDGPRKIHVGSLPTHISENQLRSEFQKYGTIEDVFICKDRCEDGRQWAFVSFSTNAQAQLAKKSTDNVLTFPGSIKAAEVTLARNQGKFGQDGMRSRDSDAAAYPAYPAAYGQPMLPAPMPAQSQTSPKKIFVGSLPDNISEAVLNSEFSKYGQVTDVYLKTGCEPGRQWAFITYDSAEQATFAKNSTDRVLVVPGGDKPCEVMLARNQGKFGQEPLDGKDRKGGSTYTVYAQQGAVSYGVQPPPPTGHPPAHLTPWRTYYTAAGLPYYHNSSTGVTQWECPPDFQVPASPMGGMAYGAYPPMYPQMPVGYRPY